MLDNNLMFFCNDFIEIYDNTLSNEQCKMIINRFENNDKNRQEKLKPSIINTSLDKVCTQLSLNINHDSDNFYNKFVINVIENNFYKYRKKFPYLQYGSTNAAFDLCPSYNLQKYSDGEGYYPLHCEHGSKGAYRMLVWMIYLNDAKSGTWFSTQKKTIKPKRGRLVIWPAGWTHPHKGVTPNSGLKYILTGWWNYIPTYDNDGELLLYKLN